MRAGDLRYLAQTADLARLDFATTHLRLHTTHDRIVAQYVSAYSAGERAVPRTADVPDLRCELDAAMFVQLCGLFADDDDLRVSIVKNDLQLRAHRHQVKARLHPYDDDRLADFTAAVPVAHLPVQTLRASAELAAGYAARNIARPLLTGIRLIAAGSTVGIQAYNGYSALYTETLSAAVEQRVAIVIPAQDLVLGLKLLGEGDLTLGLVGEGNSVELRTPTAWFRCNPLTGEWPSLKPIMEARPAQEVMIAADTLRAAVAAVKSFAAENIVGIVGTDRGVRLQTVQTEAGQYVAALAGTFRGTVHYDVADVTLVQDLGPALTLAIPDGDAAACVTAGTRRAWVVPKAH